MPCCKEDYAGQMASAFGEVSGDFKHPRALVHLALCHEGPREHHTMASSCARLATRSAGYPINSQSRGETGTGTSATARSSCGVTKNRDTETGRSEEHTSELQSLMRISYAVFCLNKKKHNLHTTTAINT